ncbi:MAG: hypothetical protein FWF88_09355 [Peptococcaceae bacterium]|nr:hypothetical protein [Peptococcaceae bacterium]
MNKILVELTLPAAEQTYDVYLPLESEIGEIVNLLCALFSDLARGKYMPTANTLLCDTETGDPFDKNKTAANYDLKNGSRILLM